MPPGARGRRAVEARGFYQVPGHGAVAPRVSGGGAVKFIDPHGRAPLRRAHARLRGLAAGARHLRHREGGAGRRPRGDGELAGDEGFEDALQPGHGAPEPRGAPVAVAAARAAGRHRQAHRHAEGGRGRRRLRELPGVAARQAEEAAPQGVQGQAARAGARRQLGAAFVRDVVATSS